MSPGCAKAQPDDCFQRVFPECQQNEQRMDAELKSRIKKIIIGFTAFVISACWLQGCMEEKKANEAAEKFRKGVNGSISEAHQEVENRPEDSVDFNIDGLVRELTEIKEQLKDISWFIDCGDDDHLLEVNLEFAQELRKAGIPFELRVREGGHKWEYWRSALRICLPYITRQFGR